MWRLDELIKNRISRRACTNPYIKNALVLVLSHFFPFYGSLEINYQAQLNFYKLDDVYLTSHDAIFTIFHLYGTAAVPLMPLGHSNVDAGLINRTFYAKALMSLRFDVKTLYYVENVDHDHSDKLALLPDNQRGWQNFCFN